MKIMSIMAEELQIPYEAISKRGKGTELIKGVNRNDGTIGIMEDWNVGRCWNDRLRKTKNARGDFLRILTVLSRLLYS
jgi:hypothetical protein